MYLSSTSPMGCCVAGGLHFGARLVQGHQHALGVRLISVPPIQVCCQHAWCVACKKTLPPREGGLHDIWSDCTNSCRDEAASLVIGCALDPTRPCGFLHLSVRITEKLAILFHIWGVEKVYFSINCCQS